MSLPRPPHEDLLLVTTYVPVLSVCARAALLVLGVQALVHVLETPAHVVAAAVAAAAYLDALGAPAAFVASAATGASGVLAAAHGSAGASIAAASAASAATAASAAALDAACGYLAPVAFALVAQPPHAGCVAAGPPAPAAPPGLDALAAPPAPAPLAPADPAAAFRWLADFVWSFAATFEVAAAAAGLRVPAPPALRLLTALGLALVHVALACEPLAPAEMALRAVLFYVQCAVCALCGRFTLAREYERRVHAHAALFVLFVHIYAALAGFLIVVGVHVRFIFHHRHLHSRGADDPERPHPREPREPRELREHTRETARARPEPKPARAADHDYLDLVRKLQAAKAASGVA
jgi:hypothetical protein